MLGLDWCIDARVARGVVDDALAGEEDGGDGRRIALQGNLDPDVRLSPLLPFLGTKHKYARLCCIAETGTYFGGDVSMVLMVQG